MKDLKRIFLVAIFAMASIAVNAQATYSDAVTAYNEAQEVAQAKDYNKAIQMYKDAIKIAEGLGTEGQDIKDRSESAIPKLYFSRAATAFNNFKSQKTIASLDVAITQFEESRKIGSDSGDDEIRDKSRGVLAQLHYQKATMLFKREDFAGADAALNKAIEVNANYAKAYYQKSLVYKKMNPDDMSGILSWLDRAIAVGTQVNDGGVVRQSNESAHAELLFRGSKSIEQGQNTSAIETLKLSLDYDSESADSYYRLAEASNKLGKRDDAIRYADQALTLEKGGNTDKAKIYFEKGVAYQAKNDKGNACQALKSASFGSFRAPSEHKMEFELKCKSASPE